MGSVSYTHLDVYKRQDFDCLTVVIILTMVLISGTLRFVQESRSGNAAEKLLALITTTCTVTRKDQERVELPMDDLVVGDLVHLSAGDMIPADVRILEAKDLFVSQASLTGESEPIEKVSGVSQEQKSATDYPNIAFMGSNVISGSATAVVVCVGDHTLFGSMASAEMCIRDRCCATPPAGFRSPPPGGWRSSGTS